MKKVLLFAAGAAMFFAGCSKDTNNTTQEEVKYGQLTIKVRGNESRTRTATTPAFNSATDEAEFNDGYVFVFKPDGTIVTKQALTATAETSATGEALTDAVPSNGKVLVFGNVPAAVQTKFAALVNGTDKYTDVVAITEPITSMTDYKDVLLGNVDDASSANDKIDFADCAGMTGSGLSFTSNVNVGPMISRIEMANVAATTSPYVFPTADATHPAGSEWVITSFNVTGVFVDNFTQNLMLDGTGKVGKKRDGTTDGAFSIEDQLTAAELTAGNITKVQTFWAAYVDGNVTTATAATTATSGAVVFTAPTAAAKGSVDIAASAALTGSNVWSYNVASLGAPNIVIRLSNVVMQDVGKLVAPHSVAAPNITYNSGAGAGVAFLRINSFLDSSSNPISNLAKGTIYSIGTTTTPIKFTPANLKPSLEKDPEVTLNVAVDVTNWVAKDTEVSLAR